MRSNHNYNFLQLINQLNDRIFAHHGLADVPFRPLVDLHPELVLPSVKIALQPEIQQKFEVWQRLRDSLTQPR